MRKSPLRHFFSSMALAFGLLAGAVTSAIAAPADYAIHLLAMTGQSGFEKAKFEAQLAHQATLAADNSGTVSNGLRKDSNGYLLARVDEARELEDSVITK